MASLFGKDFREKKIKRIWNKLAQKVFALTTFIVHKNKNQISANKNKTMQCLRFFTLPASSTVLNSLCIFRNLDLVFYWGFKKKTLNCFVSRWEEGSQYFLVMKERRFPFAFHQTHFFSDQIYQSMLVITGLERLRQEDWAKEWEPVSERNIQKIK